MIEGVLWPKLITTRGKKRTTEIMGSLRKATNIKRFIDKNISSMEVEPFHEYIKRKCLEKGVEAARISSFMFNNN